MDMPWYGYFLSLLSFLGIGYGMGLKSGAGMALTGIMAQQAKMQQMPGFPGVPPSPAGR